LGWWHLAQNLRFLQHIGTFGLLKNLRYSIYITTQKGESEPMDLPFVLFQSLIFRAYGLTTNLKMRYGADILLVSVILPNCMYSQYITTCENPYFID